MKHRIEQKQGFIRHANGRQIFLRPISILNVQLVTGMMDGHQNADDMIQGKLLYR